MFKKILSFVFLVALSLNLFSESIRDYVCVVEGNFSEENEKFLNQYKDEMAKSGYSTYSEYIDAFLQGTFGSGFIYYSSNGTPFVITNKHVVSEYETVNVYFENDDGSTSEFKELKIVATDDDIDIAIIALPEGFKRKGLELYSESIYDGDDVWSAGFPGLGGEPMWQLGKGIVSNSKAKIKELLDPSISTLIQHTAEIDGGNSGGPLLVKNSKANAGYSVVGINTWKAYYRQNTNYAIPAKVIKDFVEKNASGNATIDINTRVNSFVKAMSNDDDFYGLSRYISNAMISEMGQTAFKKTLSIAPEAVRSTAIETFIYNPIDGMRFCIAYWIWTEFRTSDGFETPILGSLSENAEIYSLEFNPDSKSSVGTKWIKENGQWKLSEFDGTKLSSKSSSKNSKDKKSGTTFTIESVGVFELSGSYLSTLNTDTTGSDFYVTGISELLRIGLFYQSQELRYVDNGVRKSEEVSTMGPFVGLQIPMLINSVIVEPFAFVRGGIINFFKVDNDDIVPIVTGFGIGINIGYEVSTVFSPFVSIKYTTLTFEAGEDAFDRQKVKTECLSIGLGLKF